MEKTPEKEMNQIKIINQNSNTIYVVKAISVVLIVMAHMPFGSNSPQETVRVTLSQIGVFTFFVCSGFLFVPEKALRQNFWRKKVGSLLIPWLLFASLTFLISCMLSGKTDDILLGYVNWTIGMQSVYWYMAALLVCMAIYRPVFRLEGKYENRILRLCTGISLISVILSAASVIPYDLRFNQYTNVFNWIGVFSLGILIRKNNWIELFYSKRLAVAAAAVVSVCVWLCVKRNVPIEAYIDTYSLPVEIFGCICVFFLANKLQNSKLLIDIGKKSFFIYLVHIQVAGAINTRLPHTALLFVLRPFIAVAFCYFGAKVTEWVLKKLKWYDAWGQTLALR